jgi:hypothetical protein
MQNLPASENIDKSHVSKLGKRMDMRSEGPTINRPGRQAGIDSEDWMSADGAAHAAVPHLRR